MKLIRIANMVRYMNEQERQMYESLQATHAMWSQKLVELLSKDQYEDKSIEWRNKYEAAKAKSKEANNELKAFREPFAEKARINREESYKRQKDQELEEERILERAKSDPSFQRKIERAIEEWPRTDDPRLAGYILQNGEMLAFSYHGDSRDMDHRYITQDIEELSGGTIGMLQFQYATGAIRMHLTKLSGRGYVVFDCLTPPTRSQQRAIMKISEGKEIALNIDGKTLEFDDSYSMIEEMGWY